MTAKPKKMLIVGGGTAGWMAAHLMMARWDDVEICLLESQDIATVGVGEGSTPHLKLFFDALNIAEAEWMPRCNATYKNGIYFTDWSFVPGYEQYFHPFPAQVDDLTVPMFFHSVKTRLQGKRAEAHPDHYFLESYLTKHNLGPLAAECFPFTVGYGYHFDSALLGRFLAEKAEQKGIKRLTGTVTDVVQGAQGELTAVRVDDDSLVAADFFVDCTGFKSLLLQNALQVPFKSYKENLFNDAAVVMPTPISEVITPATRSSALSSGWAWNIPLTNRYGNGYVYSSDYITPDQAEAELRQHLGVRDGDTQARHLTFKVGRAEKHWEKNCLAVGLSQGFIEPLEATALALAFDTVTQFMALFEKGQFTNKFEGTFNDIINGKMEGIRDYIVCHYKANQRQDTPYWRDNAANTHLSDNLGAVLHLWMSRADFPEGMAKHQLQGSYQAKSWACLLAGCGLLPPIEPHESKTPASNPVDMAQLTDFIRRCGLNFKSHNQLLAERHGE